MKKRMDEKTRWLIGEIEKKSRFPTGIGKIERGECPRGGVSSAGCTLCPYGHIIECHHPMTCEEARCGKYQYEMEVENYGRGEDEEPS
jgi:hypothetical protein